jgi:zinc/manganese transport system permease protein
MHLLAWLFAPGFFDSAPVRLAVLVGGASALVSGVVGVLTVIRGQSFAGHALADVGTTGGSGALLLGLNPLWGFVVSGLLGAGLMESFGVQRERGRDLATGIVLGAALGLSALFLFWDATYHNTTGASIAILFGSMFTISSQTVPLVIVFSIASLAIVAALYRPLLFTALSADLAAARGVPVRVAGLFYLLAMALAVSLACMTIGAILSTALLIGPGAAALRLTKRPGLAMLWAAGIGVGATWLGILLAYDSFQWPPAGHGWPVSFFVVALVVAAYLLSGVGAQRRLGRAARVTAAPKS